MSEPPHTAVCPQCGGLLSAQATRGLCTKCLFTAMLDSGPLDTPPRMAAGGGALPRTFGPFELLEEEARGGMGIVYKARQTQAGRIVAVKVLAAGHFAAPDFVERFRTEAEAVAALDHPNIVPVHEVGECEGQPYFSMKFMEGGSLAKQLRRPEYRRSNRTTVELMSKIARAVHFAHQHGILHRDIKPGNVLLDARGEPYLTDFGLAKLLEKDSSLTRSTAMLGTPGYMSPEQARGKAKQLSTAVDVYGLGAIMYELLTGQPPFSGGTPVETMRKVLDEEPPRPSTLTRGTDRDLETICLKCLEKEPAHRYGSAEALAEDLDRWMGHEPIHARPAAAAERMAKWIRRNKAAFAALVSIVCVLAAGLTVSIWQAVRATDAEGRVNRLLVESRANESRAVKAEQEAKQNAASEAVARQEAQSTLTFLLSVFSGTAGKRDPKTITLAEKLDEAALQLDGLSHQPEEQKAFLLTLGRSYLALQLPKEAIPLLTQYRDYCERNFGANDRQTCVGDFLLAAAWEKDGRAAEGQALREQVLQRERQAFGETDSTTLNTMAEIVRAYMGGGSLDKAIPLAEELLQLRRKATGPDSTEAADAGELLAGAYVAANRVKDAVEPRETVLQIRIKSNGPEGPGTAEARKRLADVYNAAGQFKDAARIRQEILTQTLKSPAAKPGDKMLAWHYLAKACLADGRLEEALQDWAGAAAANETDRMIDVRLAGLQVWFKNDREHDVMNARLIKAVNDSKNASDLNCVAKLVCLRPSAFPEVQTAAQTLAKRAIELGRTDPRMPWYQLSLGMAEYRLGHYAEADKALLAAEAGANRTVPVQRKHIQDSAGLYRAMSLLAQGKEAEARAIFDKVAATMKPAPAASDHMGAANVIHDDMVVWLAHREAKGLLNKTAAK